MTYDQLEKWDESAKPLKINLADSLLVANRKRFSTGSRGWHESRKVEILVGTEYYMCQVNVCVTLIGSKDAEASQRPLKAQEDPVLFQEAPQAIEAPIGPPGASQEAEKPSEPASAKPKRRKKREYHTE